MTDYLGEPAQRLIRTGDQELSRLAPFLEHFLLAHRSVEECFSHAHRTARSGIELALSGDPSSAELMFEHASDKLETASTDTAKIRRLPVAVFLRFRVLLDGASGAESEAFRLVELVAGERFNSLRPGRTPGTTTNYRSYLEESNDIVLITDRVAAEESRPSLIDVINQANQDSTLPAAVRRFQGALTRWRRTHRRIVEHFLGDAAEPTLGLAPTWRLTETIAFAERTYAGRHLK